jgi:hypothetical protein
MAVLIDELGDAVTALARAARALDPRYVQHASDIAECEADQRETDAPNALRLSCFFIQHCAAQSTLAMPGTVNGRLTTAAKPRGSG